MGDERESSDHITGRREDWGKGVMGRAVQLGVCSQCCYGRMCEGSAGSNGRKCIPGFSVSFFTGLPPCHIKPDWVPRWAEEGQYRDGGF